MQSWPSRTHPGESHCSHQVPARDRGVWAIRAEPPPGQPPPNHLASGPLAVLAHMKATEEGSSKSEVPGSSPLTWSYLVTETTVALHNYSSKMLIAAANELVVLN